MTLKVGLSLPYREYALTVEKCEQSSTSASATVWLKTLHEELTDEGEQATRLREDLLDRILLARLSLEGTDSCFCIIFLTCTADERGRS